MRKFLAISLGLLAALGGFVDIGDLVFASQAGAKFGLHLLWVLALGTVMIMVYAEMSGRVAAIAELPTFTAIRQRFPKRMAITTLIAASLVNFMTCAAEIGGVALILQLLSGLPYRALIVAAFLALILIIWLLSFGAIEKIFGYLGLSLLVMAVAAFKLHPAWSTLSHGFVPQAVSENLVTYAYFAVGILSATLMPYEVYFYSSGALEENWKPRDLVTNKINTIVGFSLGGILVASIIIVSARLFQGAEISPEFLNTTALNALIPYGQAGLLLALLGMLFSIGGSAVETCFAGAYNLAQYFGWKWGISKQPLEVKRFTLSWLGFLTAAFLLVITGLDPISITEYAVIFSVVIMPLTYLPILLTAKDEKVMGHYKNKGWNTMLAWIFFVIIVIASVAAIPLMIITQRGQV